MAPATTRLVAGLAALAAGGWARAADPCAEDLARFCDRFPPLQALSCLQAHRPDLTKACRDRVETTVVELQEARQDCEPDAFAYCRAVGPGQPTVACLSARQGQLTPRCQAVFDGLARREAAVKQACAFDAGKYCPDAKPGKGDVLACLLFRGRDLSLECRTALRR